MKRVGKGNKTKKKIDIYKLIGLDENEKDFVERYYRKKYNFFK